MGYAVKKDDDIEEVKSLSELIIGNNHPNRDSISKDELVEIIVGEECFGPIWSKDLREYLDRYLPIDDKLELKFEKSIVKRVSDDEWIPLFSHTFFQRRAVSKVENLESTEQIWCVLEGELSGPHSVEDVKFFVRENKLSITDEISLDGGESWSQLFLLNEFDRRDTSLLPKGNGNVLTDLTACELAIVQKNKEKEVSGEDGLVADLAFLEQVRAGKVKDEVKKNEAEHYSSFISSKKEKDKQEVSKYRFVPLILSFITVIVFAFAFIDMVEDVKVGNQKRPEDGIIKMKEKTIRRSYIRDNKKTVRSKRGRLNEIKRKKSNYSRPSFKSSSSYKKNNLKRRLKRNDDLENNYYGEDELNDDPYKQDPYRKELDADSLYDSPDEEIYESSPLKSKSSKKIKSFPGEDNSEEEIDPEYQDYNDFGENRAIKNGVDKIKSSLSGVSKKKGISFLDEATYYSEQRLDIL